MNEYSDVNQTSDFKLTPPPKFNITKEYKRIIKTNLKSGLILRTDVVNQALAEGIIDDRFLQDGGYRNELRRVAG